MSNKEKCVALLDSVPEYKMGYVLAYLQGLTADETDEVPNAVTIAAMQELKDSGGELWTGSTEDLFAMLDAEDGDDA